MGRYRPPQLQGSKYILPAGERRLRAELDALWRVERPQVTAAVSAAAAQGDRSENAEYTYGKKRLREIDSRVRFLRKRLDGMVIVAHAPSTPDRVFFGARVTLIGSDGAERRYHIVGPDELDLGPERVSMDAPLARALLGKSPDAEVTLTLPGGTEQVTLVQIEYPPEAYR
ncbi:MAG: transcription elongation factor GreB [Steroidobacteraceae bacterium]